MSWTLQSPLKRIPLARPITPKEHDENWGKLETDFQRTQLEFTRRMPDPATIGGGSLQFNVSLGHHECVGMIFFGDISNIPIGWTIADGVSVPAPDGAGGITTFTPPNMVDQFLVAAGGTYTVGQSGGAATIANHNHGGNTTGHALEDDEIPDHNHTYSKVGGGPPNQVDGLDAASLSLSLNTSATTGGVVGHPGVTEEHDHGINGDGGHDNRPPYKAYPIIVFIDVNIP